MRSVEFDIGNLVYQVRGITYKKEYLRHEPTTGYIPVLRANNIGFDFQINYNDLIYLPEELIKKEQILQKGDILIVASRGSRNVVGKGALFNDDRICSFGAFCRVVRPASNEVIAGYIALYFQSARYRSQISRLAIGANILNIKKSHIDELKLIAPADLPEQRQIVAALGKVKVLIGKRKDSIDILDKLLRDIFLDTFGDPIFNPKDWDTDELGNCVVNIVNGSSPKCENYPRENNEQLAVLRLSSVSSRRFNPNENKLLPENARVRRVVSVNEGDVLISRKNSPHLVGASAYVLANDEKLLLPDTIFKIVRIPERLKGTYLWCLINDLNFRNEIQKLASGAAGAMPNISKEKLRRLEIPVPPIEIQTRFDRIARSLEGVRKKLLMSKSDAEKLFQSLMQRAFHGDLTFDANLQLDAHLKNKNIEAIKDDPTLLRTLIDRFNTAKYEPLHVTDEETQEYYFEDIEEYNWARNAVFDMLNEGTIEQVMEAQTLNKGEINSEIKLRITKPR